MNRSEVSALGLGTLAALMLLAFVLCGCGRTEPKAATAAPFITPEERSRMSVEERDDPYTLQHLQTAPASQPRR